MSSELTIELLADRRDAILSLAAWFMVEWEPYYGVTGSGNALQDLQSRCNRREMPAGLVAIGDDGVVGTVALDLDPATGLSPSIVGLLVGPDYRGQGVGTALVKAAEDLARRLDFQHLYISTVALSGLLQRMGWTPIGDVTFTNAEQGYVFKKDVKPMS